MQLLRDAGSIAPRHQAKTASCSSLERLSAGVLEQVGGARSARDQPSLARARERDRRPELCEWLSGPAALSCAAARA